MYVEQEEVENGEGKLTGVCRGNKLILCEDERPYLSSEAEQCEARKYS